MLPQENDRSHRFVDVTAVTAPQGPFKKVTKVIVSRMRPQSQFEECYCCRRFKNFTAFAATRMVHMPLLQECYGSRRFNNFTAVAASRMLPLSSLQECYCCDRVEEGAAITAPRMLPLLPFLHLSTPSVFVSVHSHTLFGVSCRDFLMSMGFFDANDIYRYPPEPAISFPLFDALFLPF